MYIFNFLYKFQKSSSSFSTPINTTNCNYIWELKLLSFSSLWRQGNARECDQCKFRPGMVNKWAGQMFSYTWDECGLHLEAAVSAVLQSEDTARCYLLVLGGDRAVGAPLRLRETGSLSLRPPWATACRTSVWLGVSGYSVCLVPACKCIKRKGLVQYSNNDCSGAVSFMYFRLNSSPMI